MAIKLKTDAVGAHTHVRVFVGKDEDHLALSGVLVFREDEYREFNARMERLSDAEVFEAIGMKEINKHLSYAECIMAVRAQR